MKFHNASVGRNTTRRIGGSWLAEMLHTESYEPICIHEVTIVFMCTTNIYTMFSSTSNITTSQEASYGALVGTGSHSIVL